MFFFNFLEYDDSGSVFDSEAGYGLDVGQPEFGIVRILRLDPVQFRMLRLNPTFKKRENSGVLRIL